MIETDISNRLGSGKTIAAASQFTSSQFIELDVRKKQTHYGHLNEGLNSAQEMYCVWLPVRMRSGQGQSLGQTRHPYPSCAVTALPKDQTLRADGRKSSTMLSYSRSVLCLVSRMRLCRPNQPFSPSPRSNRADRRKLPARG